MKGRKEMTRWRGVDLSPRTFERHRHSVSNRVSKKSIRRSLSSNTRERK